MVAEWRTDTLGALTVNYDGKRKPVKEADRRPGSFPYYGASGIVDYVDGYLFEGDYLLVAEDGENLRTRQTPIAFMASGKFWVNNHAHIVTANERADTKFLMYALRAADIDGFLTGAVMPKLTQGNLNQIPIVHPPLQEQRAIARILGTLDDKIELNRRSNETLEAMARALFKDWFVDFGPVRARHEGREPYLAPELWSLFPNEFGDGETPTGWFNNTLGTEVRKANGLIQTGPFGSQLHASDYASEGIPVVMPKDLVDRRISTASVARIPPARTEPLARHRLIAGDIVYSRRGDVERFAVVSQRENGWLCGTGCLLVRPGPNWKSTMFLAETLDHASTREWIVRHAIGATMPNLNTGILGNVPLLVPTEPVLVAFEQMCASWQKKKEAADAESETLATLRDTLLPKLLSGELRVRGAEPLIEAPTA